MKKIFLTLICVPILVLANPTYDATQGALQNNSALCGYGYNSNCSSNNGTGKHIIHNITVTLPSKFGALAVDKKIPIVAGAINMNSRAEAERRAIANCERVKGSTKCKVATWTENGCLAASGGRLGKQYKTFSVADAQGKVESTAMKMCKKSGAKDCKIVMPEGCSLPEIPN